VQRRCGGDRPVAAEQDVVGLGECDQGG
jgi:hypothetical protein